MLSNLRFNAPKCETNARLCLGRIRLLKNKKNMQMRAYRKDIADLLCQGKLDYAIIRVESVIREQLTLTAYEILELFLELVAVRTAMIAQSKTIPGDMMEAVSSVLYASSRCPELEELVKLRALFEQKYGKEYVSCALSDREAPRFSVNERLARCLTVEPPPPDMKLQTLSEIAQEYGVEWDAAEARRVLLGDYNTAGSGVILRDTHSASAAVASAMDVDSGLIAPAPAANAPQQPPALQMQQLPAAPAPVAGGAGAAAAAGAAVQYADIAAAAQAAAVAAAQARAAADAAARFAAGAGVPPGGGGGMASTSAAPAAAPPAAAAAPSSSSAAAPGGFRVPSSEEVQRAYDAAHGPPPKPSSGAAGGAGHALPQPSGGPMAPPPAAPPVKASDADVAAAAAAAAAATAGGAASNGTTSGSGSGSGTSDLPSVPHAAGAGAGAASSGAAAGGGGGGGVLSGSSAASDFDELQRRFEALKKS